MSLRDWAIKRLGGHTKQDVAAIRAMCDKLADSVRADKPPIILRDGESLSGAAVVGPVFIVGSYVNVTNCMFWVAEYAAAINVSPVSEGVVLSFNHIQGPLGGGA